VDRILYRVSEAATALSISRSKAYELVANGSLRAVRIGRSVRVPAEAIREIAAPTDTAKVA